MPESVFSVLAVDDEPRNLRVLEGILHPLRCRIRLAGSGEECLRMAAEEPPDIILLDVMMPGMDGYEVCARLKADAGTRDIPVVFVTALGDTADEEKGFALGAVDYLAKPVRAPIVLARVRTHLALHRQQKVLEQMVRERTAEIARTQGATIYGLATLAEFRDNETGGHLLRTQEYMGLLASVLRERPAFHSVLDDAAIELLRKSAPLHDIGKVGIRDDVLLKPGRLTTEEFELMKQHPVIGHKAIMAAEASLGAGEENSFLRMAREITHTHHERCDGKGYPRGVAGSEIPVSGRLMAVADVYDALISKRVYKAPLSHAKAVETMAEGRATQFDPDVLAAFLGTHDAFRQIALRHADSEEERAALQDRAPAS